MAVLPQFTPAAPVGNVTRAFDTGMEEQQSWMNQNQQRNLQQLQAQREQQQIQQAQIMMPVMQAKAQADLVGSVTALDVAHKTQEARAQYYTQLPQAMTDFNTSLQIQDPDQRDQALQQWAGKYSGLSNIAELSPQVKNMLNVVATNHNDNMKLKQLGMQLTATNKLRQMLIEGQFQRTQLQQEGANQRNQASNATRIETANVRASAPTAQEKDMEYLADAETNGDPDRAQMMKDYLQKKAGLSSMEVMNGLGKIADREAKMAQTAQAAGDQEGYAAHMGKATALQQRIQSMSQAKPGETNAQPAGNAVPKSGKFYSVDPKSQRVMFSPSVKTPDDQIDALQEMVKDGVITPARARATLMSLGFTPKKPAESATEPAPAAP